MEVVDIIVSLLALIILEIVLGIDNLVFLFILTEKLPLTMRKKARQWGLTFSWITRLGLLASAVWLTRLTKPWFVFNAFSFSGRDLFLFVGGIFLLTKATQEIRYEVGEEKPASIIVPKESAKSAFKWVVFQVAVMDIVFSLDSVLTAIGLTNHFWIMAIAITFSIVIMLYASEPVSRFIDKYPTVKMLALSFLILIGMVLIADGFSFHIPRGYVYFAMGFSLGVEMLNITKRTKRRRKGNG